MSLWQKLFGQKKRADSHNWTIASVDIPDSSSRPWTLTCIHCGKSFVIGEDAYVVTDEDKDLALREAGATIVGTLTRKPDLVAPSSNIKDDEKRKESERRKAIRIREAIARGEVRSWWCGACHHESPNYYPAP